MIEFYSSTIINIEFTMQKIVELIGLEEQHAKATAALEEEMAQKNAAADAEHTQAMNAAEARLQTKDQTIDTIVAAKKEEIAVDLKNETATDKTTVTVTDIEKVILEHIN